MLYEFLTVHRDEIVARTRAKVATRMAPRPSEAELEHGVPLFIAQLAETLRCEQDTSVRRTSAEMAQSALKHGGELREAGFTVGQVVHGYGDVCQAVTELAMELEIPDLRRRVQDPQPVPGRGHRAGGHRVRPPA